MPNKLLVLLLAQNSQLYGTLTKEDANNSKLVDLSSNNDSSISHQR